MKISSERLALTHEFHALVIDYWHDVDHNWGRNASDYYTEDGVFESAATYVGREKIRAFYKWREERGARTVVHSVHNFQARLLHPDEAVCHWYLMLYGADGEPILPTHPPIQIAHTTDLMIRDSDASWLVKHRKFETLFAGSNLLPVSNSA